MKTRKRCAVVNCLDEVRAKDLCSKHYQQDRAGKLVEPRVDGAEQGRLRSAGGIADVSSLLKQWPRPAPHEVTR